MKLSIRRLVVLMCVGLVLLTALALSGVSAWQTASFASNSEQHLSDATDHRIDTAVSGLYNVVATQSESLSQRVATDMQVANDQLGKAGGFRTGGPTVRWQAKNQLTQEVESVELPQARVGSTWLGQVTSPGQAVPVVDPTKKLVGDTATIFQRMNDEGDMLRVATNVVGKDGKRVIGTYIAAKGADGKPNPEVVRDINDTQARIAAAVEEQSATTAEVARGITHASDGVTSVRGAITEVNGSAQRSAAAVREARGSADELDAVAARLAEELSAFRI